jgi:hypothetical protein
MAKQTDNQAVSGPFFAAAYSSVGAEVWDGRIFETFQPEFSVVEKSAKPCRKTRRRKRDGSAHVAAQQRLAP